MLTILLLFFILLPFTFASDNETVLYQNDGIYVSDNVNDGDGSQTNPYNSIHEAVENYNLSKNSNIYIQNGNYSISSQVKLNKSLTIIGQSRENTVLESEDTIFNVTKDVNVSLINLTFKNSKSSALFIDFSSFSNIFIDNCIFKNNNASAIYYNTYYSSSTTTININNSIFDNNYNKDGAAIYMSGGIALNISNSIFKNNHALISDNYVSNGGVIYSNGPATVVTVNNCNFINNSATKASGIYMYWSGNLSIFNSNFTNNTSPGSIKYNVDSCLIYCEQGEGKGYVLTLKNNTYINNSLNNDIQTKNVEINDLDKNIKLITVNVDKIYGDDLNFIATLTDINGNPIGDKLINFNITNTQTGVISDFSNTTNSQGKAILSLNSIMPGKYKVLTFFNGDSEYNKISVSNELFIKTENQYNLIFDVDNAKLNEGDSFNVTGYIYDEYLFQTNALDGNSISIDWYDYFNKHLALDVNSVKIENGKFVYDINRLHLITSNNVYLINFSISSYTSAIFKADLKKDFSNINGNLSIFHVSKYGDDSADGSKDHPLKTLQTALSANYFYGGNKTIMVGEGEFEISTFTILGNVVIVGNKTVLKQTNGEIGMFEIDSENNVTLINLTLINGYARPSPDALIHVCDNSVLYIENCQFSNNSAVEGGAISISAGGSAYINNSRFIDNTAILGRNGGVIYVDRGYLYISNSLFENNTAGDGGAIYLGFPAQALIVNTTFINNQANGSANFKGLGGAIFTRSNNLTIENSTFIKNHADNGAGIYIDYGAVYIYKSYFENNYLTSNDDGIANAIAGPLTSYCNITIHYSILISDDSNYQVYIPNIDENHTCDLNYNYWLGEYNSNAGFTNQTKIIVSIDNEYIYTGDVVEFKVEFLNYNLDEGTSKLNESMHDLNINILPSIGKIENNIVTIKNNIAYFTYNATTVGVEEINIINHTKYKFNVLDGSDKIKITPIITISPDKITVLNIDFDESVDGNITVKIGDETYSVEVNQSKAILKINTTPGFYTVRIIYQGDLTYKGFIASENFTVNKFKSAITVDDITVYYNGIFKATLKNDEGNPIKDEILLVFINNTQYSLKTDENGTAILNLNLTSTGVYNVTTTFSGNENYQNSEANSLITVEFAQLILTIWDNRNITPIKGNFSFILTDNLNTPIRNMDVTITFNKTQYVLKTDDYGLVTINLDNNYLPVGSYPITAEVKQSAVFSETNIIEYLNITKEKLQIQADNIEVYANNGELIISVSDRDGKAVENINITVLLNQTTTIKTNESGLASLKLNLNVGNYTALLNIDENPIYEAETEKVNINVCENNVILKADNLTVYYSNAKFMIYLTDTNQKAITNEKIIVKINNNNYLAYTNESGVGIININNLPLGIYIAEVQFEGNNIFKSENTTALINVVSSIDAEDLTRTYNSPYDFKAILKDESGNIIQDSEVKLIVNGREYISKTDSQGVLQFSQKLNVGTYAITITNPKTNEKTSYYTQIIPRITNNKDMTIYYTSTDLYKVKILNDNGLVVNAGESVKITISGKTQIVKTDKNGYVSFKLTQNPGSYKITATYKDFTVSNKITIKPLLTAKNISKKKAKKIKFTAKLINTKGIAVKGKKITFKIKGKTYKIKTNNKGIATLTLKNLKVGKYTITSKYSKSTIKNTIKIKK